jgi:nucleotide-binding universal stress UspA family protein
MTESITHILVPVDFSSHSDRAFRYALRLASRFGASVELLHVVDNPLVSGTWTGEVYVPNLREMLDTLLREAEKRLAALKSAAAGERVSVETHVLTGRPAHEIVERARTDAFDLIVMGTHGRHGILAPPFGERRRACGSHGAVPRSDGARHDEARRRGGAAGRKSGCIGPEPSRRPEGFRLPAFAGCVELPGRSVDGEAVEEARAAGARQVCLTASA